MHDPTISEVICERPWPSPVSCRDVINAAQYLGVKLRDSRVPRADVFKVSYLVEQHARLVAAGQR
jgi:hypothetical protein